MWLISHEYVAYNLLIPAGMIPVTGESAFDNVKVKESNILMSVHNGSKIDRPVFDLRIQHRRNSG